MPITSRFVVRSSTLLLTIGFGTLIVIVGMTIWLNTRAQRFVEAAAELRQTRMAAVDLRDALRIAESSQRGYLLTGNEIYLAPLDNAETIVERQLQELENKLSIPNTENQVVKRLKSVVIEKLQELDRTVRLKSDRKDAEALTIIGSNRGKSLMDEANVFLFGIILDADERLIAGESELRANAALLRIISVAGGLLIIVVVSAMLLAIIQYTREASQARDEIRALNTSLEERVKDRTRELMHEKDRAEVLLSEVNHRVANSLSLVGSLVRLQSNSLHEQAAKDALNETQSRIYAIESVHRSLYTSGDVRFVALNDYLTGLLSNLERSMHAEGHTARLKSDIAALTLRTDKAINLGVILNEWVTNAFKYAYPEEPGEIRVRLSALTEGQMELIVEDDGIGRKSGVSAGGGGFGTRIVKAMALSLKGEIEYISRQPGSCARLAMAAS